MIFFLLHLGKKKNEGVEFAGNIVVIQPWDALFCFRQSLKYVFDERT